jgi:hypothetical protein
MQPGSGLQKTLCKKVRKIIFLAFIRSILEYLFESCGSEQAFFECLRLPVKVAGVVRIFSLFPALDFLRLPLVLRYFGKRNFNYFKSSQVTQEHFVISAFKINSKRIFYKTEKSSLVVFKTVFAKVKIRYQQNRISYCR